MNFIDWKVGDKVVCIDGRWGEHPGETNPVEGGIYTIRTIEPDGPWIFIRVEEIRNPNDCENDEECYFNAAQFRPVTKRKTSIEIFTAMLTDTKVDA